MTYGFAVGKNMAQSNKTYKSWNARGIIGKSHPDMHRLYYVYTSVTKMTKNIKCTH